MLMLERVEDSADEAAIFPSYYSYTQIAASSREASVLLPSGNLAQVLIILLNAGWHRHDRQVLILHASEPLLPYRNHLPLLVSLQPLSISAFQDTFRMVSTSPPKNRPTSSSNPNFRQLHKPTHKPCRQLNFLPHRLSPPFLFAMLTVATLPESQTPAVLRFLRPAGLSH